MCLIPVKIARTIEMKFSLAIFAKLAFLWNRDQGEQRGLLQGMIT